jgi:hypothetical protein
MNSFLKGVVLSAATTTLLLATASAIAGTGINGVFNLGVTNSVDETTTLTGAKAGGKMLNVTNTSTAPNSAGLGIQVAATRSPLTVNATAGKATNLNVDKLDGLDSTELVRSLWAVVASDGTLLRGKGATGVTVGGGGYFVRFNRNISACAYTATVGALNTAYTDPGEAQAFHSTGAGHATGDVYVAMSDTDTGALSRGFSLVVTC